MQAPITRNCLPVKFQAPIVMSAVMNIKRNDRPDLAPRTNVSSTLLQGQAQNNAMMKTLNFFTGSVPATTWASPKAEIHGEGQIVDPLRTPKSLSWESPQGRLSAPTPSERARVSLCVTQGGILTWPRMRRSDLSQVDVCTSTRVHHSKALDLRQ